MKTQVLVIVAVAILMGEPAYSQASQPPGPVASQSALSNAGIFVVGKKGQTPEQQKKDESECIAFAKQQTGADPSTFQQETQQKVAEAKSQAQAQANATPPPQKVEAQKARGGRVAGAARGAAGGAAIGAIAGDAGKGAAIGATAGAMRGGVRQRRANKAAKKQAEAATAQAQQQQQQAQAQAVKQAEEKVQAEAEETKKNFKNAFAAYMEAKDYSVKW